MANAVGLAIASKHLAARFNKPDYDIVSPHIWCMTGDACLQEGVGLEAISLAGHLRLNNLTLIYDNNQITCDGLVSLTNTEDVNKKMEACGWKVIEIEDGCFDIPSIVEALQGSKHSTLPTFINVKTIIGIGSTVAGSAVAHGMAFGVDDVASMKKAYGFNPAEYFSIPPTVREFYGDLPSKGNSLVADWQQLFSKYSSAYPDLAAEFVSRQAGDLPSDWESLIPCDFPSKATPSRASSGLVFNPLAEKVPQFLVGTADLSPSVHMNWKGSEAFEPPHLKTGSYAGRYIHYGIREHAMAAVANGIAAWHPNMIIPVTSTSALQLCPARDGRKANNSLDSLCFTSTQPQLFVWERCSTYKSSMQQRTTR